MCPQYPEKMKIYGDFYTERQKYIVVYLLKCDNATSPVVCADPVSVDAFYSSLLSGSGTSYVAATILTKSANINPTNKIAVSKFIDIESFWLTYTDTQAVQTIIWIGTYEVETDESFLPWNEVHREEGSFTSKSISNQIARNSGSGFYL